MANSRKDNKGRVLRKGKAAVVQMESINMFIPMYRGNGDIFILTI